MATASFFTKTNMDTVEVFFGTVVTATSTRIEVTDGSATSVYLGKGFRYAGNEVVGGRLTGYEGYVGNTLQIEATGLNVRAPIAFNLINAGDAQTLFSIALSRNDQLNGSKFADLLRGFNGGDQIDGGRGNDRLFGGDGRDFIAGESGNDTLNGEVADDRLEGGLGADHLLGGRGADELSGGASADRFVFVDARESTQAERDLITDFSRAEGDLIDLTNIDARVDIGGNQSFSFIGNAAFSDSGQVRFFNGLLSGDINGDGAADFVIKVNGSNLGSSDIFL